jgi:nitronate monooxygenase
VLFAFGDLRMPVVQAPMAGGVSTPALAAEVTRVGGLGFVASGYLSTADAAARIAEVRARDEGPFGVNVFVPQPPQDRAAVERYREELAAEAERYGVTLPEPDYTDDDHWAGKVSLLLDDPVPVVSFTFGPPPQDIVLALHDVGSFLVATVTSPSEARTATALGVDALCVQGPAAGGHRGTYDPFAAPGETGLIELIGEVRAVTDLPLIAAGGLMTGAGIREALRAGAKAVQLGTVYLRAPEAGTKPEHRAALLEPAAETVLTRAFSGRFARGLRNRFTDAHQAPPGYPQIDQLTRPLRAAAAARGDAGGLAMWTGTGFRHAVEEPAAALTTRLWESAGVAA